MGGSVIAVASLKGGSGKTTLACCLAVHWHLQGRTTLLVDADPQRSAMRLAERPKSLGGVALLERANADVWNAVQQRSGGQDVTVIDTPGFDSDITVAALAAADLVLIPVKASPLDVDRMMDTVKTLMNGVPGWTPTFRCVLTQTTRGSVIARHVREELTAGGFPLLACEMPNRVAYAETGLFGATPSMMMQGGSADRDIVAIAAEIEPLLGKTGT